MPEVNDLRIWHIPQIPGKPFVVNSFVVDVSSVDEGAKLLKILADYDLFQFNNRIKADYANAQGLEIYDGESWIDWYDKNDEEGALEG